VVTPWIVEDAIARAIEQTSPAPSKAMPERHEILGELAELETEPRRSTEVIATGEALARRSWTPSRLGEERISRRIRGESPRRLTDRRGVVVQNATGAEVRLDARRCCPLPPSCYMSLLVVLPVTL
jgi:hypothetical protein